MRRGHQTGHGQDRWAIVEHKWDWRPAWYEWDVMSGMLWLEACPSQSWNAMYDGHLVRRKVGLQRTMDILSVAKLEATDRMSIVRATQCTTEIGFRPFSWLPIPLFQTSVIRRPSNPGCTPAGSCWTAVA